MPSFHPEVCMTVSQKMNGTEVAVTALLQHFWRERLPNVSLPCRSEIASYEAGFFTEIKVLFDRAHAEAKIKPGWICIDGMPVEACEVASGSVRRFKANAGGNGALQEMAIKVVDATWSTFKDRRVRNALACCVGYVGRDYPMQESPPEPEVTRLAVMGTPSERAEFLDKLSSAQRTHTSEDNP